ncbi:MAG: dynamin family protein [Streptosporangiaceae bacterium]
MRSDTFNLIVMGRFKNGKSTLVNALLGPTTRPVALPNGCKGPMMVDDLPATATLTGVRYAEEPYVRAWGFDAKAETWSLARYLDESTLGVDELENQRRFQHIREFEMGYPAALCKEGVLIYDSPGVDEHYSRTAITLDAVKRCDAAIIVYRSGTLMGQNELANAAPVLAEGTKVFTVVNLLGGRQVDDRLRGLVWNRYVRDLLWGPAWTGQDLSQYGIYMVDGMQARDGRYGQDEDKVMASGLDDFERSLAKFLVEERQPVHLQKFVALAGGLAAAIDVHIAQRHQAARQDREALKAVYAVALSELAMIRAGLAKMPEIFARYRAEAEAALTSSFARLVADIRAELPGHMESLALPSANKIAITILHQKKLYEEAATAISDFVADRIGRWSTDDTEAELAPILERLADEIESQIAQAGQLDKLDGLRVNERVLAVVASARFGATPRGTAVDPHVLYALFVTVSVPAAASSLSHGGLAGGAGLEARIKQRALKQSDDMLAQMLEQDRAVLAGNVAEGFELLKTAATRELSAIIDEEQRQIERAVELSQREDKDRDQAIAALTSAAAAVAQHRLALQRALIIAGSRQGYLAC